MEENDYVPTGDMHRERPSSFVTPLYNPELADRNVHTRRLYEDAIRNGEGLLSEHGALVVKTGPYTGRSPDDKFIIVDSQTSPVIDWKANKPFNPEKFDALAGRIKEYLQDKHVYTLAAFVGADPTYRMPIEVVTPKAWQVLFAKNLFRRPTPMERTDFAPAFTVVSVPDFKAVPQRDGTRSEAFILINFDLRMVLIGGTHYAGEIKKSMFTIFNHIMPEYDVFPMHCSANYGKDGDVALFFGLSGTGKTTLSADPTRTLIGDDEHGWSQNGVFNFEGGCYAKVIKLSPTAEPDIYRATQRPGTILENVVIDPKTRVLNLDNDTLTENTRAAYPLEYIPNMDPTGVAGHPTNVFFLTADAFGVLPPISKLTSEQAAYHFLSGYTAKLAGTERGVKEPKATFSACFGQPFLTRHPREYAEMLKRRLAQHNTNVWLINTGWTSGSYGTGHRMSIDHTRAIIRAALEGKLNDIAYKKEPIFGLAIPQTCPNVPGEVLNPAHTWADPVAYETKARELAALFEENAKKFT